MTQYRGRLPQLSNAMFATDGGLETTLIFQDGVNLPCFAAFDLLCRAEGRAILQAYYERYASLAHSLGIGFVLEAPTWRANRDWGARLGYDAPALAEANRRSIEMMAEIRRRLDGPATPMVISGNLGPRGDGYEIGRTMSPAEACDYHEVQIATFAATEADYVSAMTINYVEEGLGTVAAAERLGMEVVISFTLETDGRLPSGQALADAIAEIDGRSAVPPVYYMINCAHPTHFDAVLDDGFPCADRIRGIRANASRRSHAELDEAADLDDGDPAELGRQYAALRQRHRSLNVLGGCCGTDFRHVQSICLACLPVAA